MTRTPFRDWGRLARAAALLAPVVVVQLTRVLSSSSLPSASAAAGGSALPDLPVPAQTEKPLTEGQRRASDFLMIERANTRANPSIPSPLYAVERAKDEPPAPPTSTHPTDRDPTFVVTGIMAGERRQLASVNGRIVTAGDEVAPGWKVAEIDASARAVLVADESGRTIRLTPPVQKVR